MGCVDRLQLKRGRPRKYGDEIREAVIRAVRNGRTLTDVAAEFRLPLSTVWSFVHKEQNHERTH